MNHHVSKSKIFLIIISFTTFLAICWLVFSETVAENWRVFQIKQDVNSEIQETEEEGEVVTKKK